VRAIREQIASALHLIMQVDRLPNGRRVVTALTEVQGMEGETILLQDVFNYRPTVGADGKPGGELSATGLRPRFLDRLHDQGIEVPARAFHAPIHTNGAQSTTSRVARTAAVPSAAALVEPERVR
jgi:pilus assembly protein CpaF